MQNLRREILAEIAEKHAPPIPDPVAAMKQELMIEQVKKLIAEHDKLVEQVRNMGVNQGKFVEEVNRETAVTMEPIYIIRTEDE